MVLSFAMDLLVSGLLIVTISYAMVLNKKIGTLRKDRAELEKMAASFNTATTKADRNLKQLKTTAEELKDRMERARTLRDDLIFLNERSTTAADKLEELVRTARERTGNAPNAARKRNGDFAASDFGVAEFPKPQAPEKKRAEPKRQPAAPARSEAERELIRALQAVR